MREERRATITWERVAEKRKEESSVEIVRRCLPPLTPVSLNIARPCRLHDGSRLSQSFVSHLLSLLSFDSFIIYLFLVIAFLLEQERGGGPLHGGTREERDQRAPKKAIRALESHEEERE